MTDDASDRSVHSILHHGELTTPGRLRRRGLATILPAILWLGGFLLIPSLAMMGVAFLRSGGIGIVEWEFTLENFHSLAGFGVYGWTGSELLALARSLWLAGVTTAVCVAFAYPISFYIALRQPRMRVVLLALVMIPFCTNMVVRTFGWHLLFHRDLPFTRIAQSLHLIGSDESLRATSIALYVGMVSNFLPFAILPLYTNVERLEWSVVEAARDLYAGAWRTFRHAILPQTMPGLLAALVLTFIPAMGVFLVPDMLGSNRDSYIGTRIKDLFGSSGNYPLGAAAGLALVMLTLAGLYVLHRFAGKAEEG